MIGQSLNRKDNDVMYRTVKNVSGATLTTGHGCTYDVAATTGDGVRVTAAATATLSAFAGVAAEDIANSDFGRIIVYGYVSSIPITTSAGSSVAGDLLGPTNGATKLSVLGAASATAKGFAVLCSAIAGSSSSAYAKSVPAFIRAL